MHWWRLRLHRWRLRMSCRIRTGRDTAVAVDTFIGIVGIPLSVVVGLVGSLVVLVIGTARRSRRWLFANVEESTEDWKQRLPRV